MTGSMPVAPCGLMMRTRTSPAGDGTVIHSSSTGSLLTGADCASSRTLRASAGAISYRNGGLAKASATCCAAGSRTIVLAAVMTTLLMREPETGITMKAAGSASHALAAGSLGLHQAFRLRPAPRPDPGLGDTRAYHAPHPPHTCPKARHSRATAAWKVTAPEDQSS